MILTIDPGASGGIAVQDGTHVTAVKMPDTEGDILSFIKGHSLDWEGSSPHPRVAYVEHQTGVMGPNIKISAAAMFTFGEGYGFLKGVLQSLGWQIELVRPQKWQKALSLGTKASAGGRTPWKNKLKSEAQRLYPGLAVTLSTADALLLLHYANLTKQII